MKLIFLYGPPAVGKLTIAKVLEQQTGYKLLHNHLLVNPIAEVFPFENPANRLLVREFRLRILEEAAVSNINLIATFGIAGNDPFVHIRDVIKMVTARGGEVYVVHLAASYDTLLRRVENQSRKDHGKNLSKEKLQKIVQENPTMFEKYPGVKHLTVDTDILTPEQAGDEIIKTYLL